LANEQLVQYIKNQLQSGYGAEAIKQHLLQNSYPAEVIDISMQQALSDKSQQQVQQSTQQQESKQQQPTSQQPSPHTQQSSGNPQLTQYIRQQLQQGYSQEMIEDSLLSKGYSHSMIQASMNDINEPVREVKHTIGISGSTILLVIIIFLGIGLLGWGGYRLFSGEDKLLDYTIEIDNKEVELGGYLYYTNRFTNMGSKKSFDIIVEHKIENRKTNEVLDEWGEELAIDQLHNVNSKRRIDAEPGEYILRGIVKYDDKTARAFDRFSVVESAVEPGPGTEPEPSCYDNMQNQGEEDVDCGGPCDPCEEEKPEPQAEPIIIDDSGSDLDKITKVEMLGTTNPSESEKLCKGVVQNRRRDDCFLKLSNILNSSRYCQDIESDSKKDVCYMYFVNQHDYDVCEYITNSYIQRSCFSLQQINSLINTDNSGLPADYNTEDTETDDYTDMTDENTNTTSEENNTAINSS